MATQREFTLQNAESFGGQIRGLIDTPGGGKHPTVVICHGFKGFMEWGFFPPLAELLVARGFTVVRFNFSGTGMAPGDDLVTDLAAFRDNTFSLELREIQKVLASLETLAPDDIDVDRLALLGHSRGGGGAVLAAVSEPWRGRLKALVTWAAVSTFDRFGDAATMERWRREGVLEIQNGRTGQRLELGSVLLDDIEQNRSTIDILNAASQVQCPWLIVHGSDDETVLAAEAEQLDGQATALHELLMVENGGHTFGARHPFQGPTRELTQTLNATQTWLRRHV